MRDVIVGLLTLASCAVLLFLLGGLAQGVYHPVLTLVAALTGFLCISYWERRRYE